MVTEQQIIELAEELNRTGQAVERLREGDYYGDSLPDAIADIAKSLRILSGREQL